ncbi:hypothetical protein AB0F91_31255 [Amycolatopsis sp. NPDC023774]|uniref:hypothetical protein n=1 Tax=Amycolatopsis sp. NPDC023774 TaxID=3155015 RepID=UPI0033CCA1A8
MQRGISYGLFGEPDEFVPQARALGGGLVRAYVFWSQVEPRPGEYDWTAVDAQLAQLDGAEEVWLTVCSSSPWATKVPTDFLPPSPAHDPAGFRRFVRELCGAVRAGSSSGSATTNRATPGCCGPGRPRSTSGS